MNDILNDRYIKVGYTSAGFVRNEHGDKVTFYLAEKFYLLNNSQISVDIEITADRSLVHIA